MSKFKLIFFLFFSLYFSSYLTPPQTVADCIYCFEFFGCTVKTKNNETIKGFIIHNNYGYSGKSSPFNIKGKGTVTIYKHNYTMHDIPGFIEKDKNGVLLGVKYDMQNIIFIRKTDLIKLKTYQVDSIKGDGFKSKIYNQITFNILSEKSINLLINQKPFAVTKRHISFNREFDTYEKLRSKVSSLEYKYLGYDERSKWRIDFYKKIELKYKDYNGPENKKSKVEAEVDRLCHEKYLKDIEKLNIILVHREEMLG